MFKSIAKLPSYLFSYLLFYFLFLSHLASAEIWLNDDLYLNGNQYLIVNSQEERHQEGSYQERKQGWQLLPELSLTQGLFTHSTVPSKLHLGAKLNLQKHDTDAVINNLSLTIPASQYLSFTLGRQKISYTQADMFHNSLSKNDNHFDRLNYSQGLLTHFRVAFFDQQLFIQQKDESKDQDKLSYHYQMSLGIPGYLAGPLNITLESESNFEEQETLRAMIGSAIQLPLRIFPKVNIPGDWQWAFQYASELDHKNQIAWQTSLSWLGFIPSHKLGFLWSHTDEYWQYSNDYQKNQNTIELRYQWRNNQKLNLELGLKRITDNDSSANQEETVQGQFALGFHF